jgi:hypothetical protein
MNDRFERRQGEWRIARRIVVIEEVDARIVTTRSGPQISVESVRGPADAIYELLRG